MKTKKTGVNYILTTIIIMAVCSISTLHAQHVLPKLPSAVEIDSMWITGTSEKGGAFFLVT